MYRNILIATDGSEPSAKAVDHGVRLAKAVGAALTILTVTERWSAIAVSAGFEAGLLDPIADYERLAAESAEKTLASARETAKREGVTCATEHIPERRPSEAIVEAARNRGCDLIVMGSHGRRGLDRLLLGSQANEVLTRSSIPVLIVR